MMSIIKKISRGSNSKFIVNLLRSLGIVCVLVAISSCNNNLVNKNNKGSEKMLPSEPSKSDDFENSSSSSMSDDEDSFILKNGIKFNSIIENDDFSWYKIPNAKFTINQIEYSFESLQEDLLTCVENFTKACCLENDIDLDYKKCSSILEKFHDKWKILESFLALIKSKKKECQYYDHDKLIDSFEDFYAFSIFRIQKMFFDIQKTFTSKIYHDKIGEDESFDKLYKIYNLLLQHNEYLKDNDKALRFFELELISYEKFFKKLYDKFNDEIKKNFDEKFGERLSKIEIKKFTNNIQVLIDKFEGELTKIEKQFLCSFQYIDFCIKNSDSIEELKNRTLLMYEKYKKTKEKIIKCRDLAIDKFSDIVGDEDERINIQIEKLYEDFFKESNDYFFGLDEYFSSCYLEIEKIKKSFIEKSQENSFELKKMVCNKCIESVIDIFRNDFDDIKLGEVDLGLYFLAKDAYGKFNDIMKENGYHGSCFDSFMPEKFRYLLEDIKWKSVYAEFLGFSLSKRKLEEILNFIDTIEEKFGVTIDEKNKYILNHDMKIIEDRLKEFFL